MSLELSREAPESKPPENGAVEASYEVESSSDLPDPFTSD
jgi:hypothetical protein